MPSHKPVKSLQSLSLSTITKNCKKNQNPFAKMPNRILIEIMNQTQCEKYLSTSQLQMVTDQYTNNLEMVIHQFTDRLDFSKKPLCVVQRAVELICKIRPKLTHLNLCKTSINVENLKELVKSIPNIQSLQLRSTSTTDEVLTILAQNCPDLRILDISNCKIITDTGIDALCNNGKRLIQNLKVYGTSISDQGALMVMRNFPHLRHFDYRYTVRVLETIYNQLYNDSSDVPKIRFQLEIIHHRNEPISSPTISSSLSIAALLCPNVTHVLLSDIKNTDTWLTELAKFPKLAYLVVVGLISEDLVAYPTIIAPLLRKIGKNLIRLILYRIQEVDLRNIGKYCKQLKGLNLEAVHVSVIPFVDIFPLDIFCNLREFSISCISRENGIQMNQLEGLLSNCVLIENLYLWNCRSLTDHMFSRVLEFNSFTKLRHFSIKHCGNIETSSLLPLVRSCKFLQVLDYRDCANIEVDDHQQLQDLVKRENLDLSILFGV